MFLSQDGTPPDPGVANLSKSYASQGLRYLRHIDAGLPINSTAGQNKAHVRIANHYKFIMQTFFDCFRYPRLILLEV